MTMSHIIVTIHNKQNHIKTFVRNFIYIRKREKDREGMKIVVLERKAGDRHVSMHDYINSNSRDKEWDKP